jgi:hypothetical protein
MRSVHQLPVRRSINRFLSTIAAKITVPRSPVASNIVSRLNLITVLAMFVSVAVAMMC